MSFLRPIDRQLQFLNITSQWSVLAMYGEVDHGLTKTLFSMVEMSLFELPTVKRPVCIFARASRKYEADIAMFRRPVLSGFDIYRMRHWGVLRPFIYRQVNVITTCRVGSVVYDVKSWHFQYLHWILIAKKPQGPLSSSWDNLKTKRWECQVLGPHFLCYCAATDCLTLVKST